MARLAASAAVLASWSARSASRRSVMSRVILLAPTTRPDSSRIGEMVRETSMRRPSLATRTDSKWSTRSPRCNRSRIAASSPWRSAGRSTVTGRPTISSVSYPKIRRAPRFQEVMMPSRVLLMMASSDDSTMATSQARACSTRIGGARGPLGVPPDIPPRGSGLGALDESGPESSRLPVASVGVSWRPSFVIMGFLETSTHALRTRDGRPSPLRALQAGSARGVPSPLAGRDHRPRPPLEGIPRRALHSLSHRNFAAETHLFRPQSRPCPAGPSRRARPRDAKPVPSPIPAGP